MQSRSLSYAKIVQGECRTSSLLERYAEPQPILCKDLGKYYLIMKHLIFIAVVTLGMICTSCAHSSFGKLVGSDRDEHGCIGSAGYTWSYALHSCVRLWEVGTRFDNGPESVFLIYSPDSTFAEIFPQSSSSVLCKRVKNTNVWRPKKGNEEVSIVNGVTCVKVNDFSYTRSKD